MKKKRNVKKFLYGLLILVVVTTCFQPQTVHAETHYTKGKLTQMIKKTQKEVVAAKKKWNSEKKIYQAQTKGATLVFGNLVSSNPLIIKNALDGSLYWMTDSKYLTIQGVVGGYIKSTGSFRYYDGHPCAVAKSVKVTVTDPTTNKKTYEAKKDKLDTLKDAIKNYAKFDKNKQTVYLGKKVKLGYSWNYIETYNNKKNIKLLYDKSMVKVTYTNEYVCVTPLKEGTTKITISNELVKKKSVVTLNIIKKQSSDDTKNDEFSDDSNYSDDDNNSDDNSYSDDDNDSDNYKPTEDEDYSEDNNDDYDDNDDDTY